MSRLPDNQRFGAPWGGAVKFVSLFATLLLLGLPIYLGSIFPDDRQTLRLLVLGLPLLILAGSALFVVRGYRLEGRELVVQRLVWDTRIALNGFRSASINPDAMRGSIRLFGNGGLFAISGLFRNRNLGIYRAFVTDPTRCVVLQVADGTLIVSPDRPEEFLAAVNLAAKLP